MTRFTFSRREFLLFTGKVPLKVAADSVELARG